MGMNIVIIITTVAALGGGIFAFWMDHCNKTNIDEDNEQSLSKNETKQSQARKGEKMNIGVLILIIIGGVTGFISTAYIVLSLIGTIAYKIYRSLKYHVSLYD